MVMAQLDRLSHKSEEESGSPNYSLIAGAYLPASCDSQANNLADTLIEKPPSSGWNDEGKEAGVRLSHEQLADRIASRLFAVREKNAEAAIIEHEKMSWSSRFECLKFAGGIYAAHRFAPQFMPPEPEPAALLAWKNASGTQHIAFGGISRAEALKELKSRYVATCIGSMAAGWAVSHAADSLFFSHDQYLEGTLCGDVLGIGLAIAVPDCRRKAVLVAGTHLLGRTIDHFFQPHYQSIGK